MREVSKSSATEFDVPGEHSGRVIVMRRMLDVALFFVICYIYNTRFCTIMETEEFKEEEENEGSCFRRRVVDDVCVDFDDSLLFSLSCIDLFAVYFIIDYYKFGAPLCMRNSMISNPLSPAKRLMPVNTVTKSSSFINSILPNNLPVPKLVLNSTKFLM